MCGRAATTRRQILISDTRTEPSFAAHLDVADAAHFRAVQSTPLYSHTNELVGVVSTHFPRPGRPANDVLRALRVYSDVAGGLIAQKLCGTTDHLNLAGTVPGIAKVTSTTGGNPGQEPNFQTGGAGTDMAEPAERPESSGRSVSARVREQFGIGC